MKETLEEAAERLYPTPNPYIIGIDIGNSMKRLAFIEGAKWQQEKIKEQLKEMYLKGIENYDTTFKRK
jgi:hypothetical protein